MVSWTSADQIAYEARRKVNSERLEVLDGCEKESELHQQIVEICRARGYLAFHGSMAHQTFRTEGEPDFQICLPNGRFLMVECKTRTGKLSIAQQSIHAWAARLNHKIHTVRSYEEFLNLLTTNDNQRLPGTSGSSPKAGSG